MKRLNRIRNIAEALAALGFLAAVTWFAGSAKAADLGSPAMGETAVMPAAPAPRGFGGSYIGGAVGMATGNLSVAGIDLPSEGLNVSGIIGYNFQTASPLVVGIEADLTVGQVKGDTMAGTVKWSGDWTTTLRARLGYAMGSIMPYVTAGYGWADKTLSVPGFAKSSDVREGFVYGAGLEAMLTNTLNARVEVLRTDFRDKSIGIGGVTLPDTETVETVGRAGLTFRLN